MNKTTIPWCDYTWNPIVGCQRGCSYCYAKKINDRFKFIPDFKNPVFFPERLEEPSQIKKPSIIFVCSMGEIFHDAFESKHIYDIIQICEDNPQHIFMFLTRRWAVYNMFDFPKNCILGYTANYVSDIIPGYENVHKIIFGENKSFISIEPILGGGFGYLHNPDLVIVGAQTGAGATPPCREWVDSIVHRNIFYKDNIIKHFPDLTKGSKEQIWQLMKS